MRRTVGVIETLQMLKERSQHQSDDPRVSRWALRAITRWRKATGKSEMTQREKGQAILEDFDKFRSMDIDADDAAAAFAAAAISQGLTVAFIGESHTPDGNVTHVTVEVQDGEHRYRFDPLYGKGPDDIVPVPNHVVRVPD